MRLLPAKMFKKIIGTTFLVVTVFGVLISGYSVASAKVGNGNSCNATENASNNGNGNHYGILKHDRSDCDDQSNVTVNDNREVNNNHGVVYQVTMFFTNVKNLVLNISFS